MELKITRETRILDLKKQFAQLFPYLKLEFFKKEQKVEQGPATEKRFSDATVLGQTGRLRKEGYFVFTPVTTVNHFEQKLQNEYGLPVHVFRKTGNVWIETGQTDSLSLNKQNAMGKTGSKPFSFNQNSLFL